MNPRGWLRRLRSWWTYRPSALAQREVQRQEPLRADVGKTIEDALARLRAWKWDFHYVPDRREPTVIAAVRKRRNIQGCDVCDVVILSGDAYAYGYRAWVPRGGNPFNPDAIGYATEDAPVAVCGEIAALPDPSDTDPPATLWLPNHAERALMAQFLGSKAVRLGEA